jgi:hypothetical protein
VRKLRLREPTVDEVLRRVRQDPRWV